MSGPSWRSGASVRHQPESYPNGQGGLRFFLPAQSAECAKHKSELKHWHADATFTGVRDPDALAKLPAEEHAAWQHLWAEVEALLRKTGDKSK